MIRSAKEDQPSASVPAPPSSSNTTACRYKNPLGSSTTLLTFTTKSGELIDADVDYDSGLDEHTIARIDQAKCSECKVDTRMAPAANKDLELDETIITGTKGAPVTERRKPFVQNEGHEQLKQAGVARASQAADVHHPKGTTTSDYAQRNKDISVLQQHITFFDPDGDGIIWPLDTFRGFRALGYSLFISILSLVVIHANFSWPTLPPGHLLPDPFCRVHIARIHRDKHGSDSGTYDSEGRFIPQKFEDIFSKYGDGESLTFRQTIDYLQGQRVVFDFFGWGGAIFEWLATWILLWPDDGKVKKEDIRGIYDGSIFYQIAARRTREGKNKKTENAWNPDGV